MNSAIYRQYDSRWGDKPYPTRNSSFAGNGCGCCACTHVIIERPQYANLTPEPVRVWMVDQGLAYPNQGTLWSGIPKTLQHYGFTTINHDTVTGMFDVLDKRKAAGQKCLGVILFGSGTRGGITWTTGGHYVAFVDYKKEGGKHYLYTKDSGSRKHDGWYCYETTMKGLIPQIWSALPPNSDPGPTPIDPSKPIAVDGVFGAASVAALQKAMGTSIDGCIGGQLSGSAKYHMAFSPGAISYDGGGSACIKALQKMLKLDGPDGYFGPNTIKALQKFLNLDGPDGYFGPNTAKAFQTWLNNKLFPTNPSTPSQKEEVKPTPTPTPAPTPAPTPTPVVNKVIEEDGVVGRKTLEIAQEFFGTPVTGEFGGQLSSLKKYHKGFASGVIEYGSGGSALITAMQKYMGLSGPDGQLGPNTIKAVQKMCNLSNPDGVWGPNTSKGFQHWLNEHYKPSARVRGMDISAWQDNCSVADFKKAKDSGIEFVILRVGYTGTESRKPTLDKCFENNYKNAKAAGLKIGYYYYSTATNELMAQKEAEFTLANIKGKQCDFPVYLDVEDPEYQKSLSKSTLAAICNKFCILVKQAGYKAGVYASLSWFNSKIGNITAEHSKWVAQYYSKCEYKGAYDIWQYTSEGTVPGIGKRIDLDYWYKK